MTIKELGHVVWYATDLEKSVGFYRDALGFVEFHRQWPMTVVSGGHTHHELLPIK